MSCSPQGTYCTVIVLSENTTGQSALVISNNKFFDAAITKVIVLIVIIKMIGMRITSTVVSCNLCRFLWL